MTKSIKLAACAALSAIALGVAVGDAAATLHQTVGRGSLPRLVGRAVLPAETLAPGPPAGALVPDANGIDFWNDAVVCMGNPCKDACAHL